MTAKGTVGAPTCLVRI
jgi:hypothetical protein